jgi:mannose-6-phosphate isomerase
LNYTDNIKRVEKPWGYELWWAYTDKYVGKILHINEGECLSYQYHVKKDETIYLLSGNMHLEIEVEGEEKKEVNMVPGESIRIKPYTKHRFTALSECEVLEASTPEVDDVVRLEDRYGRVKQNL